jgi:hypothetical protein
MRIARLLAIALTLISLGTLGAPASGIAASPPTTAHVALIDLGGLFGDENEPDEDEPDEGSGHSRASAQDGAGTSFTQLLLALGLGIVATIFAGRWFFRARSWIRQLGRGGAA